MQRPNQRGLLLATLATVVFGVGCSATSSPQPAKPAEVKTTNVPDDAQNRWGKSENIDPMDGTQTIALSLNSTGYPSGTLLIRFNGNKKPEIFVVTDDILEDGAVRVKFDNGAPAKQAWNRSSGYKAVFSPEPLSLLTKLQHSAKFYLEYHPYQRTPETVIFDVSGLSAALPDEQIAALRHQAAALVAFNAKFLNYVHPCSESPNEWCWTDPELPNAFGARFPTKEEALRSAEESARAGAAFKNFKKD
jgi:hypothetical protein